MAQGAITTRIQLLDEDGNVIGGTDIPMQIDSTSLQESIDSLTQQIIELREILALTFG